MGAEVLALMLADSRTPLGGFAHSGGLEHAVAHGLGAPDVPGFMAARLATVGATEAAVAGWAARSDRVEQLLELDDELAARTPSPPLRSASRQLGRALLRVAERVWPADPLVDSYARATQWSPRPVVLGAVARRAGLTAVDAARLSLYEDAAAVAAAAVKLLPLDPAETASWMARLAPRIDSLATEAAGTGRGRLPGASTPLLDLGSLDHDRTQRRLFVT